MGLVAIDIALHGKIKPSMVVVTDLDEERLNRAASIFSPEKAAEDGIKLVFAKTSDKDELLEISGGTGFDAVFVYAPVSAVVELGDAILGFDGSLNFFAGPLDKKFSANFNFYQVHYGSTHVVGTSGGNTAEMIESLELMEKGLLNPSAMITHVGGLNAAREATLNLPNIKGGKKLIYTHIEMDLTAIDDFEMREGQSEA